MIKSIVLIPVATLFVCVFVCVCVCLCVCSRTPPRPLGRFPSYVGKCFILYRRVTWLMSHDLMSKVKVTRGHWKYFLLCSNEIEGLIISTVLYLESSNFKYKYIRPPGFNNWAWNFTQGQSSRSEVSGV